MSLLFSNRPALPWQSQCGLCLQPYAFGSITSILPCGHRFHVLCWDNYQHSSVARRFTRTGDDTPTCCECCMPVHWTPRMELYTESAPIIVQVALDGATLAHDLVNYRIQREDAMRVAFWCYQTITSGLQAVGECAESLAVFCLEQQEDHRERSLHSKSCNRYGLLEDVNVEMVSTVIATGAFVLAIGLIGTMTSHLGRPLTEK